MIIQFNTDHHIHGSEELKAPLIDSITMGLSRFSERISRIEVHLSDENGDKGGQNDKCCVLEARVEGMKPIAVTHHAKTHEQAVDGAIDKLKHSLDSTFDRMKDHHSSQHGY